MKLLKTIIILCVLCVSVANLLAEDWTSSARDIQRTRQTSEKLSDTFTKTWEYYAGSEIVSTPAVADGIIVFGTKDGYVRAIRESDKSPLWVFSAGGGSASGGNAGVEIISSPVIYQGRVYVASTDGYIYSLRLSDGALLGSYHSGGQEKSSPIILSDVLFIGSGYPNQKVIAIDIASPTTGGAEAPWRPMALTWQTGLEQIVYSSPAISGTTLVVGCNSGRYYALNKNTGAQIWSYPTNGAVLLSAPLISGTSVYLLPGGDDANLYSVDIDNANWPAANYQIPIIDPSSPATGTILGTKLSTSAPMKSGALIAFVVRFDYTIDTDADGLADEYVLNEYAIAIDPVTPTAHIDWQISTGVLDTDDQNDIPPLGLCPSPAGMKSATGSDLLAIVSSLSAQLKVMDASNGNILHNYNLDAKCLASAIVANSRVFVATRNGSIYAFQNNVNNAPSAPVAGFTPDNIAISTTVVTPTISWSAANDANDASSTLRYLIRVDDDGEVLENYDFEYTTSVGVTSVIIAPVTIITDTLTLTYAVRTIDPSGAYSGWSGLQTLTITHDITPPDSLTNLRATASNGFVDLFWNSSGTSDVIGYLVQWKLAGGSFGPSLLIGNVTNYRISSLTNGLTYVFQVTAQDAAGWQSAPQEISAIPNYYIFLMGAPYETLNDALSVAQSGDTITLTANTFILQSSLYLKEGVNLKGVAPHLTILDGTGLASAIEISNGTVVTKGIISNLTIYGADYGINAAAHEVIIMNTVIWGCYYGIYGNATSDIEAINNTIYSNGYAGVDVSGDTIIRNNIIIGNTYGLYWSGLTADLARMVISYNDVYGNGQDYVGCSAGNADISQDVTFEDEANNDYREVTGSETVDMGNPTDDWSLEPNPHGGRVNIGAYGNTAYAAVSQPLDIVTTTLSDGESGANYNVQISTLGGSPPLTWTIISGTLPAGITLDQDTGAISGVISSTAFGIYDFTVQAMDTISAINIANLSISVNYTSALLRIVPTTLSDGQAGASYSVTVSAADGLPPYQWSLISGTLPANLALDGATGVISGTLSAGSEGSYLVAFQVTDLTLSVVSRAFTITINSAPVAGSSGVIYKGMNRGCFIATAAYGNYNHPNVLVLRNFRDRYLVTNAPGRRFVNLYYKVSPPIAEYLKTAPIKAGVVRLALTPIVYSIKYPYLIIVIAILLFLLYAKRSTLYAKR